MAAPQRRSSGGSASPLPPLETAAASDGAPPPEAEDGYIFGRASVERAIAALQSGSIVLLTEDGDDGTVGSLVVSPTHVTLPQLDFFLQHTYRLQVALEPPRYRAVYRSLQRITLDNNCLAKPAISVSARGGGVSAQNSSDIARTLRALVADAWATDDASVAPDDASADGGSATFESLVCPGAVPLACTREGGILRRAGATEASVELARLAGLPAVGLHASLRESSRDALVEFGEAHGVPVSSTADLVAYARAQRVLVERCGPPARMPTKFGRFVAHTYRSRLDGTEHIALVKSTDPMGARGEAAGAAGAEGAAGPVAVGGAWGELVDGEYALRPFEGGERPPLVRVHSECCTGDVFGSLRCDCGPQLEKALRDIEADGWGVLLYLRGQEGRGIGLGAKMHAYALQERGVDTLDANLELGLPVDSREYGTGAQILADLGIHDMRLMSNNPKKFTGLTGYGLRIVQRVPSHTAPNPDNIDYLRTKLERMGHMLGDLEKADELAAELVAEDDGDAMMADDR
jgi:3,4-dihydroxy 2-butanone 4-phosphate synthase/GTP cyclohydrolase II